MKSDAQIGISFIDSRGFAIPATMEINNQNIEIEVTNAAACKVLYKTTAEWNSDPKLISKRGYIQVYSDHETIGEIKVPGMKVGDGTSYLIDLPFTMSSSYILVNTTAYWNARPRLKAEKGFIYVYSDYKTYEGQQIPGIKVGDGRAYLIDMPFIDQPMWNHINNSEIHITQQEREYWNNKVRCFTNDQDYPGNLIFTTQ